MTRAISKADYKIRQALPQDKAAIGALSAQVLSIYGNYREYLPAWADAPEIVTIVAEWQGELAGFLMVALFQRLKPRPLRYADILAIVVDPAQQRHGIGKMLLAKTLAKLAQQREHLGIAEVHLTVAETNKPAQSLFRQIGFEFTGECQGRYEGGQRALAMRRFF
jgi:ribosomal protein S18 acetylase RimI-like enzyme